MPKFGFDPPKRVSRVPDSEMTMVEFSLHVGISLPIESNLLQNPVLNILISGAGTSLLQLLTNKGVLNVKASSKA